MANNDSIVPRGFYKDAKSENWYFSKNIRGKRHRFSTKCKNITDAIKWVRDTHPEMFEVGGIPEKSKLSGDNSPFRFTDKWLSETLTRINTRNKKSSAARLKRKDLEKIIEKANGKCEVTGIPFNSMRVEEAKRLPFIPSVDRLDSGQPYSVHNCRLVCLAANIALNQWGDKVFDMLAEGRVFLRLKMLKQV